MHNRDWPPSRIALLSGFVITGAGSIYESLVIYRLVRLSIEIDKFGPHLGDVELPDEYRHALVMYPCAALAMVFAIGLLLTGRRRKVGGR